MKRTSWPSARSAHARWHEQSRKWPERGGGGGGGGGGGEGEGEKGGGGGGGGGGGRDGL